MGKQNYLDPIRTGGGGGGVFHFLKFYLNNL